MKNKKIKALIATTIIAITVAIGGWTLAVIESIQLKDRDDKIAMLSEEKETLDKKVDDLTDIKDSGASFLKISSWGVEFPYEYGVTEVKGEIADEYEGALYITSIKADDKTYDVNLCGGSEKYGNKKFYLGQIIRYDQEADYGDKADPKAYGSGYNWIFSKGKYDFYYKYDDGSGCETGTNEDYEKGVHYAIEMLRNIKV